MTPPASLPAPAVSDAAPIEADDSPTTLPPADGPDASPCALWAATLNTLVAGGNYAEQTAAAHRWLDSVHVHADIGVTDLSLVDFRISADALAASGWDFAAVDDAVLLGWVEGLLGNTLFGVAQPPVPRDECPVDLRGAEAAAVSIECVVNLEPGNRWLLELDRDPAAALSEAEADELSVELARRWLDAGASPLCVSQQLLGGIPQEDIRAHMAALPPDEVDRVAAASAALSDITFEVDYFAPSRSAEADAVIP